MKRTVWFVLGSLIMPISNCAIANDSIARIGTGGITFLKTEDVRMAQEVLEISTEAIRVKYRFQNESDKDIQATVAFPMPAYGWNSGESADETNVKPLRPFTTKVNGHSVVTTIAKKAVINEQDVTSVFRKIGLTDKQIFETFSHCPGEDDKRFELCGLTQKQEAALEKLGDWKVSETVLWEQVFPANAEVEVLHEYAPFVGGSYTVPFQKRFGYVSGVLVKGERAEACVDDGTRNAIERKVKLLAEGGADQVWVSLAEVEYILGTGRNWKGPIGDFKLRIIKDSPDQVISLCFPGKPQRVSNTVFEFARTNYDPQDKLIVYFYSIGASSQVK